VPRRWTPAVHELLHHLESAGFDGAPRVRGFDDKGREVLTYIDGACATRPWPAALRSDAGLVALIEMLKRYHAAVATFVPPANAEWFIGQRELKPTEIVCHGDL